ncbi:MAG: CDP-alcohol phosphatidyltransferase family protein [Actinomycetes bacterium]
MKQADFFKSWSSLHGNAKISGIVRGWLTISYLLVKPLAKLKFNPNILTIFGLLFGVLLYLNALSNWAVILLTLSLICDGIDGSLAIITDKASKWGAMLDSVLDRVTEFFWALTFIAIGANTNVVIAALLIASVQEYLRARAGGLGLSEVGVVTIAERPVRASILFVAIIAYILNIEIVNILATIWLVMQSFSFLTLTKFTYKKLI